MVAQAESLYATPGSLEKIFNKVLADRRLKMRGIFKTKFISSGSVISILNDHLGLRSVRWVPRLLSIDHKSNFVRTSEVYLALFDRNLEDFS